MTESTATYTEPVDPGQPINPMGAAPESDFTTGFDNYWGTDETKVIVLPDGRQSITIRLMTEGQRAELEKNSNQDLRIDREQTTTIKIDPGRSRKALLKAAIVGWNLRRPDTRPDHAGEWQDVPFKDSELNAFIHGANPKLIDKLEKEIREFNPWLKSDLSIEEIEKEIENLTKELDQAKARAAGE